jgi:signal transduction histidine kinase
VLVLLAHDDELAIAAADGQATPATERLETSETLCGDVVDLARALRIDDVDGEARLDSAALGVPDASTALLVPLVYRGRALGVLCAFDRTQGSATFDDSDEGVLTAFAASAATAVATARTVEADRLRAALASSEGERRRWARELHDETLQALGGLRMTLSAASRMEDADSMRSALEVSVEQVTSEIANLRSLIAELRPASLDTLGLEPALRTLADDSSSAHGYKVDAHIDLGERPPPDFETAIYRVAQEALTNVGKHAGATRVEFRVIRDGRQVHLSVHDDGGGFDPETPTAGFGLVGMRERVALAGGTLAVEDAQPGTRLTATFPLPDGSDA